MATLTDFVHSNASEPHRIRTRQILKSHPEIKKLIGQKNPTTFWVILGCVILMTGLAYLVRDQSWWIVVAAAWFIGAFPAHTLFVCIHEAAHNLIFRKPGANMWAAIFANLPTVFPTALTFKNFHIKHHAFQGVHELDADLPDWYEAKLIKNYSIGKAIWLLFYPIFQGIRTLRMKELAVFDKWVIANFIVQITFDVLIVTLFGWKALAFMVLCLFFSVGLHPLGARWAQEHFLTLDPAQETYSYYGPLNGPNLNVGFHNEHHDFPSIPWNKLPEIKKSAPEYYESLKYHTSFVKLFFLFLFDQEISLYSRIVRKERGRVPVSDQSRPDMELVQAEPVPAEAIA
ncbi:fatty acid desaturase [Spirosoma endophyticum]|uniref:Sphingolipid delta-4 desaturase n=1 Tax=Spirosoma endophyticum TaxID=662367 RepID=A0A1I1TKL0_9BACT|nr:fatty acid desaturase [Spirosoma endophyticum]SFD56973.1 sphingolipid delta-4 desaturase [Spirosoma endophyticum]